MGMSMNVQEIIADFDRIPYGEINMDNYVKKVIKALNKYDEDSPLAEDLEDFDCNNSFCYGTLKEAIEWLRRHGKKE
jgi:hypothetical protein